jgi:flagellar hook-associated protein 2
MAAISFSGLISGLNSGQMIDQLVSAERSQADTYTQQQSDLSAQNHIVTTLSTALASLGTAVEGMKLDSELQLRTASASDSHVSVAAAADATATSHTIRVLDTAVAQVVSSRPLASQDAGVLGAGGVALQVGTGTPVNITWDATDSLSSIASRINNANAGVAASVLYDGTSYRLVMTAQSTGKAGSVKYTDSGDNLALSDPVNEKVPARDADLMIDGIEVKRSKNVIDDAIPGVTITAVSKQAASDPDTNVTVAVDSNGLKSMLDSLVSAYNTVVGQINGQLAYTGNGTTPQPTNTLFGDSTLRQLQTSLGSLVTANYGGADPSTLGLTIGQDGTLSLDESKLDAAIAADPNAVSKMFVAGGLASTMSSFVDTYTRAGDGVLSAKAQSLTDQSKQLQSTIDEINNNADALKTRLENQFNQLEQAMSKLQSQGSYISKMLA